MFGRIQRDIGVRQHAVRVRVVVKRGHGNADAAGNLAPLALKQNRFFQTANNAGGDLGQALFIHKPIEKQHKFITTDPRHGVIFADLLDQYIGDNLQDIIARRMTKRSR